MGPVVNNSLFLLAIPQKNCSDDEEAPLTKKESGMHSSKSESDLPHMREQEENNIIARRSRGISLTLMTLEIPKKDRLVEVFKKEGQHQRATYSPHTVYCSSDEDGYEAAEETDDEIIVSKHNLFDENEEEYEEPVPREKIMERIASRKGMMSYQFVQLVIKFHTKSHHLLFLFFINKRKLSKVSILMHYVAKLNGCF